MRRLRIGAPGSGGASEPEVTGSPSASAPLAARAAGSVDRPGPGRVRAGRVEIAGWAAVDGRPASAVLVSSKGELLAAIAVGDERTDVAEALDAEELRFSGFSGSVELDVAGDRAVELVVDAVDMAGGVAGRVAAVDLVLDGHPVPEAVRGAIEVDHLETPLRSSAARVGGWAVAGLDPATVVTIWSGDVPLGVCVPQVERPDVGGQLGLTGPFACGFVCDVDLLDVPDLGSEVILRASVAGPDGSVVGWLDEVRLPYAGPTGRPHVRGQFDHWKDGDRVERGPVRVYGWVRVDGGEPAGVAISVNGELVEVAPVGERRPDLVEATGDEGFERSGFDAMVDLDQVDGDHVRLTGAVILVAGGPAPEHGASLELAPVTLRLPNAAPDQARRRAKVSGALDVPLDKGVEREVVNLWGWALGRGEPLDRVELLVDGESRGFARIGLDRMDIAKTHDEPYAASCGFEHLVDFSAVPDSTRRVEVAVVAHLLDGTAVDVVRRKVALRERRKPPTRRDEERAAVLRARTGLLLEGGATPRRDRLRLLAFTHQLGLGGAQLWLSELLERSGAGKRYECVVLAPKDGPLRVELERAGVEVHVTNDFPMNSLDAYEGRLAELVAWTQRWQPNAVLVNTALCAMGADLGVRLGLPCLWAIHESWPPAEFWAVAYPPRYVDPIVRRRAEEVLGLCDGLVFEAEATRQQFLPFTTPERAEVVHYGIDVRAIDRYTRRVSREEARERLGYAPDEKILLVVGTVEPRKAQTIVTRAFARLVDRHPDARLVLVGASDTPYTEAVEDLVGRADLAGRIDIQPIVKDTYLRYRAADLFLSASDVESLPRSVLEVMAFGVPVLATSVFGLPELIEDGETGLLFEPKSLAAAVAAIDRALSLPRSRLEELGRAGQGLVRSSYDSQSYSSAIVGRLETLALSRS